MALVGLGGWALVEVSRAYRQSDIAVTERPQTFQVWLHDLVAEPAASPERVSDRVADRLLVMPMVARRKLVNAMMRQDFWQPFARLPQGSRGIQRMVRDGVLQALRAAPTSGDLYVAAAWLETATDGFGSQAQRLFEASHSFAPRELPLVRARLQLGGIVWPLLGPEARDQMMADFAIFTEVAPAEAAEAGRALTAQGVTLR